MKIVSIEATMPRPGRTKKLETWRRALLNWDGDFGTGRVAWPVDGRILFLGP